jgi:hypothetical protein
LALVNWRSLFDHLRIEYVDRGPNTSRDRINVQCPWCGDDDPSHHMSISENGDGFYCYRNREHGGTDPIRLLRGFGLSRYEAIKLHNDFVDGLQRTKQQRERPQSTDMLERWQRFSPADLSNDIFAYLVERGFRNPASLVRRYDLRYARIGRWARRVLLPVHDGIQQITWTGRAIDADREPRYLTQEVDEESLIYIPRTVQRVCVLCEGPMDALKISAATEGTDKSAVGAMGLALNEPRILMLQKALQPASLVMFALDASVPMNQWSPMMALLRSALPNKTIGRAAMPAGVKDPGEMTYEGVQRWITTNTSRFMAMRVKGV